MMARLDLNHLFTPPATHKAATRSTMILLLLLSFFALSSFASERIDGAYSFSLTTFDPKGKLAQVERAATAASLGVPILAICQGSSIIMAAPQTLPSPFYKDDGTARFAPISPNICISHSGISADGRVLVAAAQQLAIEHAFTFDEPIPINIFLEEMSLFFQQYTMKPGARPMGVTLLIGHVPPEEQGDDSASPQLYRIDASGAVSSMDKMAIVNGHFGITRNNELQEKLESLTRQEELSDEQSRLQLSRMLAEALEQVPEKDKGNKSTAPTTILTASLSGNNGFVTDRSSTASKQ
jgi:20S proteasome alpha/beta subunit